MDWHLGSHNRWLLWVGIGVAVIGAVWFFVHDPNPVGDTDPELAAIDKLERKNDSAGLIKILNDRSRRVIVTARALSALGHVGGNASDPRVREEARNQIKQKIGDDRPEVRAAAARAWASVGSKPKVSGSEVVDDGDPVKGLLENPDEKPEVKIAAAATLRDLDAFSGAHALVVGLGDMDPAVRRASIKAIESICGTQMSGPRNPRDKQAIYNADADPPAREAGIRRIDGDLDRIFRPGWEHYWKGHSGQ